MHENISPIEKTVVAFIFIATLGSMATSYIDDDFFMSRLATEDGVIEWLTVLALAATSVVCIYRAITLRGERSTLFIAMTFLLGAVFLFGAGEEISWGQRIFNTESSEFFQQHNAQGETNLHNLVVGGKKLNKLIFGIGLHLVLLIYLLILVPLYKRKPGMKLFLDRLAVPIAKPYQVVSYLVVIVLTQVVMASSKRGELAEFAGSFLFLLNIAFPYNRGLFSRRDKG
ncbi:MAG: hypothetical protein GY753_05485 [Gammaproteobacteria bacterium]|nr:hypothetical protein [Gammaproteobacteria bacterium]